MRFPRVNALATRLAQLIVLFFAFTYRPSGHRRFPITAELTSL